MISYQNLWEPITPIEKNITQIKRDIQDGKVPELPFFIIGLNKVKNNITVDLNHINEFFQSCLVQADYGNGKTNLLKYLKLYFWENSSYNIKVVYTRADVDQYDIVLFMLRIIQETIIDELIDSISSIKDTIPIESLCNNFNDTFGAIKEYAVRLFGITNSEDLKKMIYLGTGRLYTKGSFNELKIQQLTNYNRREILVLFLNILASSNKYYIFQIDEVEKIQEKSKTRFSSFLTSFRELIDLSSFIKGHYLMTALTGTSGKSSSQPLEEVNPAFHRRIESKLYQLDLLSKTEELNELCDKLNNLLGTNRTDVEMLKIVSSLRGMDFNRTSQKIKFICSELNTIKNETLTLDTILSNYSLKDLFDETKERLLNEGVFQNISRRFFDPLCDYLDALNVKYDKKAQGSQLIYDKEFDIVNLFCFNTDLDSNINRLIFAIKEYSDSKLTIFKPTQLEITYSLLTESNINNVDKIEILEYEPEDLMTLLVMCRDESYEFENIKSVIKEYTLQNL